MHALVLVIGDDVDAVMAPHQKRYDEHTEELTGEWDYWRIGGRWAGWLKLRNGATGRMEPLSWEWTMDSVNAPNLPDPLKQADQALAGSVAWEAMRDDEGHLQTPYAIVKDGIWRARSTWDGEDFVDDKDYDSDWIPFLETLPADALCTVVDIHS